MMNDELNHLCSICQEATKGFGWSKPQNASHSMAILSSAFSYDRAHKFCSRVCQTIFVELVTQGVSMDHQSLRRFAAYSARKPLKNYVNHIGAEKPLAEYTKEESDGLIQVILDSYHTKLRDFYAGALKR